MSYSLLKDEPVDVGVRRIIRELIDECLDLAGDDDVDVDERVHEIRKALKRVRAVLRLVRGSTDAYSRENRRYRDIGRLLSDLRDSAARLETVEDLEDRLLDASDASIVDALRAALREERAQEFARADIGPLFERIATDLRAGRDDLDALELDSTGFEAVTGGLAKSYGRGRRLFAEAHVDSSVEVFHTWRKRVKYHRYHVDLLENLWAPVLDEWEDALHDLTDDLGLAHDVAVLDDFLVEHPDVLGDSVATHALRSTLHDASAEYRRHALSRGRRAFAETPEALVERYQTYWDAWRTT